MRSIVTPRGQIRWSALTLMVAALGCGEDPTSPSTTPSPELLEATATQALSFKQVSAGGSHTCGVTTTNLAYCWGNNGSGQLGIGTTSLPELRPVPVAGGLRFDRVSAGDRHTCGITTNYRAYCWGENHYGQLGDRTTTNRATPTAVAGNRSFRQITSGPEHTCAVTRWDVAFCWGTNEDGRLGTTGFLRVEPAKVAGGLRFSQVIAGGLHTCGATTDNRAYCWGSNNAGQLGNGSFRSSSVPVAVAGGLRFRMVVAGGGHILIPSEEHEDGSTCGLTIDDLAYCWGSGRGTNVGGSTPRAVPGGHRFRGINLSHGHTCAVTRTDVALCWGENQHGQLGVGTTTGRLQPTRVAGGLKFKSVTANTYSYHSCGVATNNRAYCWGLNNGQVGNGSTAYPGQLTPAAVAAPM